MTEITLDIDEYDRNECLEILFNETNNTPSREEIIEKCDENIIKNKGNASLQQFFNDMKNKLTTRIKEGFVGMDTTDYKMSSDTIEYDETKEIENPSNKDLLNALNELIKITKSQNKQSDEKTIIINSQNMNVNYNLIKTPELYPFNKCSFTIDLPYTIRNVYEMYVSNIELQIPIII